MRWRLKYALQAAGDSPLVREIDVDLPTEGLDVEGADEQKALEMMRAVVRERDSEDAVLTDASKVTD